ncbi:MAG: phosphonate metabolism protein/1,5-bisphosphokinase (PRPP-forming) PhnN [Pseudomonadota bacterium]
MTRGSFVAVVGPSGAGKDTLIREAMAGRADLMLARRVITRPPAPDSEDYESVDSAEFARRREAGAFALHWVAHGLSYGIPIIVDAQLASGLSVIANLSRNVIETGRQRFESFRVIVVAAPVAVLAERLAQRGRETAEEIAERLERAGFAAPVGDDVITVENGGDLRTAVAAFRAALPQPANG